MWNSECGMWNYLMDLIQIYCILSETSNDISLEFENLAWKVAFTVLPVASLAPLEYCESLKYNRWSQTI